MKFIISILFLSCLNLHAATSVIIGSVTNVNGTNTGTAAMGTFMAPNQTYTIQHGAITNAGMLKGEIQFSLDGTNWVTAATFTPVYTNATTETFSLTQAIVTNYMRFVAITTNAVDLLVLLKN